MTQVLEGTWEEVISHTAELSGHRVRVIILDRNASPAMQECVALMARAQGHSRGCKWAREDLYSDESVH